MSNAKYFALLALTFAATAGAESFLLGTGYNTAQGKFTSRCFLPSTKLITGGTTTSTYEIGTNLTREKLIQNLNVQASGEVSLEAFRGSAAAKFIAKTAKNEFNLNQVLKWEINGPRVEFVPKLEANKTCAISKDLSEMMLNKTPDYQGKGEESETGNVFCDFNGTFDPNSKDRFLRNCGDSFVQQVQLGAKLVIAVNFEFKDKGVLADFSANGKMDLIELLQGEAAFELLQKRYGKHITVNLTAMQIGGNVSQLSHILGGSAAGENKQEEINLLRCSLDVNNIERCRKALSSIVDYAKGEFRKSLYGMTYSEDATDGPAILDFELKSYKHGGFSKIYPNDSSFLIQRLKERRKAIIQMAMDNDELLLHADRLAGFYGLNEEDQEKINIARQKLTSNDVLLRELSAACFDGSLQTCDELWKEVMKLPKDEPEIDLSVYRRVKLEEFDIPESFLSHCQNVATGHSSSSVRDTIFRIAYALGIEKQLTYFDPEKKREVIRYVESCLPAYEIVSSISEIDLSLKTCREQALERGYDANEKCDKRKLRNLYPLKGLNKLRALFLEGNGISDLSTLTSLSNLQWLFLGNNSIGNIDGLVPVSVLPKLSYLDLSQNYFLSLPEIASFAGARPSLKYLRIDGNPWDETYVMRDLGQNQSCLPGGVLSSTEAGSTTAQPTLSDLTRCKFLNYLDVNSHLRKRFIKNLILTEKESCREQMTNEGIPGTRIEELLKKPVPEFQSKDGKVMECTKALQGTIGRVL